MTFTGYGLMNGHKFEIDTTGGSATPTFVPIAKGIDNADINNNEEVTQNKYLDGMGFGETDVIGAQLILTFSGHRFWGDAAQDYIFGKAIKLGTERHTQFKWTDPAGAIYTGDCTIAKIVQPKGKAEEKGAISFEIHFNGEPTYTPAA